MFKFEYVDNEFKLLNIDVLVLFQFEMFKFEYVDNEFRLLNIDVLVLFKLLIWVVWPLILNVEFVERLFKFFCCCG